MCSYVPLADAFHPYTRISPQRTMQHQRASCLAWVVLALLALSSCDARIIRGLHQTAAGPIPSQQQRKLLQNPDAPALTQYGGLTMEGTHHSCSSAASIHCRNSPHQLVYILYRKPSLHLFMLRRHCPQERLPTREACSRHTRRLAPQHVPHSTRQRPAARPPACRAAAPRRHAVQRMLHAAAAE